MKSMARTKTHFEQVPVAFAKKIAAREPSSQTNVVSCTICGTAVPLEHCKTDEHGEAVHESCYTLKLASARH